MGLLLLVALEAPLGAEQRLHLARATHRGFDVLDAGPDREEREAGTDRIAEHRAELLDQGLDISRGIDAGLWQDHRIGSTGHGGQDQEGEGGEDVTHRILHWFGVNRHQQA